MIAVILSQKETNWGYFREWSDSVQEIAIVSMKEPYEGMNLVIFYD
jgi:hypothetical protein